MTIRWQCAGFPHCRKTFLYARGLKAHMPSCRHAQSKKVRERRDELQTMLDIMIFVEDDQKGNITMSRMGQARFLPPLHTGRDGIAGQAPPLGCRGSVPGNRSILVQHQ